MSPRSAVALALGAVLGLSGPARGGVFNVLVRGPDVIFLAGRTDAVIPAANLPWGPAGVFPTRHGGPTPEEALEAIPAFVQVSGGDVIRLADPAVGGINFFNGFGPPFFGPEGNGLGGSNLSGLGGISGYIGPQGPLAGVFLDDSVPSDPATRPATLNFAPAGLGTNFASLSPGLRQVFFIGNGVDSMGNFQTFIAPPGATRLFLAIPDGFGFTGAPGAYDDNDGSYRVRVGVNRLPTDVAEIPEPGVLALFGGLVAAAGVARRRAVTA